MSGPPVSPASRDGDGAERSGAVDVGQLIDEGPISRYQFLVVTLCAAIIFLDGYDAQIMPYVSLDLTTSLHVSRPALGPVLSSGLFGMMIGALLFGPIADRFGRRPVLILCPLIFGVGSLLTATADSVTSLLLFRLLTGFGMGGAMPNTIAITAEFMPRRIRASAVMIMFCGFSIGAAVVGWVAAALIPAFGWRAVFVVGGILPLIITAVTIVLLPESIRFLLRRPGGEQRAARYLAKIAPGTSTSAGLTMADEEASKGFVLKQLFAGWRQWVTPLLWVMFFMNLLDLYFVNSWLPTVMKDVGIPAQRAILITTLFQVGGTVGAIVLGRVLDRLLSFRLLAAAYFVAAVCVFLIGESGTSSVWLIATVFASGFAVIGAQTSANALAAETYPTSARSTGVGWALGVGRVGSILGPLLGGLMVGATPRLFLYATIPLLLAFTAAMVAHSVKAKATSS